MHCDSFPDLKMYSRLLTLKQQTRNAKHFALALLAAKLFICACSCKHGRHLRNTFLLCLSRKKSSVVLTLLLSLPHFQKLYALARITDVPLSAAFIHPLHHPYDLIVLHVIHLNRSLFQCRNTCLHFIFKSRDLLRTFFY